MFRLLRWAKQGGVWQLAAKFLNPRIPLKTAFSLTSSAEVESLLLRGKVSSVPVVLEAHFSSFDHPLKGEIPVRQHLPGAIQIHPSYLEAGIDEARYYPFYSCPQDGNLLPFDLLHISRSKCSVFTHGKAFRAGLSPNSGRQGKIQSTVWYSTLTLSRTY